MYDISFTGGSVTINAPIIGTTVITEFSDEGTPVDCNQIEVRGNSVSLNGTLILWRKPVAYTVAVTVIPGSENDEALNLLLEASHVRPNGNGAVIATDVELLDTSLTISCPAINKSGSQAKGGNMRLFTYTKGAIVNGPSGPSTNSEGKIASRTYTFIFEQKTRQNTNGTNIRAGGQLI